MLVSNTYGVVFLLGLLSALCCQFLWIVLFYWLFGILTFIIIYNVSFDCVKLYIHRIPISNSITILESEMYWLMFNDESKPFKPTTLRVYSLCRTNALFLNIDSFWKKPLSYCIYALKSWRNAWIPSRLCYLYKQYNILVWYLYYKKVPNFHNDTMKTKLLLNSKSVRISKLCTDFISNL
jgi:hypothetical protein